MKALSLATTIAILSCASLAAADDCPPGSKYKTEDGFSYCEPSVCANDTQCSPGEKCASYPLCVQVGTTKQGAALGDAGAKRLVATQRCGPDNTCPDTTVCSVLSRCISKAVAERNAPAPSTSAPASSEPAKKSACGCALPGSPGASSALPLAGLALGVLVARRRIRRDPQRPLLGCGRRKSPRIIGGTPLPTLARRMQSKRA